MATTTSKNHVPVTRARGAASAVENVLNREVDFVADRFARGRGRDLQTIGKARQRPLRTKSKNEKYKNMPTAHAIGDRQDVRKVHIGEVQVDIIQHVFIRS